MFDGRANAPRRPPPIAASPYTAPSEPSPWPLALDYGEPGLDSPNPLHERRRQRQAASAGLASASSAPLGSARGRTRSPSYFARDVVSDANTPSSHHAQQVGAAESSLAVLAAAALGGAQSGMDVDAPPRSPTPQPRAASSPAYSPGPDDVSPSPQVKRYTSPRAPAATNISTNAAELPTDKDTRGEGVDVDIRAPPPAANARAPTSPLTSLSDSHSPPPPAAGNTRADPSSDDVPLSTHTSTNRPRPSDPARPTWTTEPRPAVSPTPGGTRWWRASGVSGGVSQASHPSRPPHPVHPHHPSQPSHPPHPRRGTPDGRHDANAHHEEVDELASPVRAPRAPLTVSVPPHSVPVFDAQPTPISALPAYVQSVLAARTPRTPAFPERDGEEPDPGPEPEPEPEHEPEREAEAQAVGPKGRRGGGKAAATRAAKSKPPPKPRAPKDPKPRKPRRAASAASAQEEEDVPQPRTPPHLHNPRPECMWSPRELRQMERQAQAMAARHTRPFIVAGGQPEPEAEVEAEAEADADNEDEEGEAPGDVGMGDVEMGEDEAGGEHQPSQVPFDEPAARQREQQQPRYLEPRGHRSHHTQHRLDAGRPDPPQYHQDAREQQQERERQEPAPPPRRILFGLGPPASQAAHAGPSRPPVPPPGSPGPSSATQRFSLAYEPYVGQAQTPVDRLRPQQPQQHQQQPHHTQPAARQYAPQRDHRPVTNASLERILHPSAPSGPASAPASTTVFGARATPPSRNGRAATPHSPLPPNLSVADDHPMGDFAIVTADDVLFRLSSAAVMHASARLYGARVPGYGGQVVRLRAPHETAGMLRAFLALLLHSELRFDTGPNRAAETPDTDSPDTDNPDDTLHALLLFLTAWGCTNLLKVARMALRDAFPTLSLGTALTAAGGLRDEQMMEAVIRRWSHVTPLMVGRGRRRDSSRPLGLGLDAGVGPGVDSGLASEDVEGAGAGSGPASAFGPTPRDDCAGIFRPDTPVHASATDPRWWEYGRYAAMPREMVFALEVAHGGVVAARMGNAERAEALVLHFRVALAEARGSRRRKAEGEEGGGGKRMRGA